MDGTIKSGLAGGAGAFVLLLLFSAFHGGRTAVVEPMMNSMAASPEVASLRLDFGKQLSSSSCNGVGSPIVNVTQKITNDADSGQAGNYWGLDTFNRTIQLWKTPVTGTYCATVKYEGSFAGVAGQVSPGNTGVLNGKEKGPIQGGYSAIITGNLLPTPAWKTNGSVGSTDYQCDTAGNCPGAINWVDQYFSSGSTFNYEWWGWIYRSGAGNTWVNSTDRNSGDII